MGRWAQQHRRGGDRPGNQGAGQVQLLHVADFGVQQVILFFNGAITASDFDNDSFSINGIDGTGVSQRDSTSLFWSGGSWDDFSTGQPYNLFNGPTYVQLPKVGTVD